MSRWGMGLPCWLNIDNDTYLQEMCDAGVNAIRQSGGVYDALRFECFNQEEVDEVKRYMAVRYPDIRFQTHRAK